MAECKLRRGIERWMASDPSAMLEQSPAAIYSALDDARSDIITLCREVQRLSAAQPAASEEPSDDEIAAVLGDVLGKDVRPTAVTVDFARALLSRYGRPEGDAQPVAWRVDWPGEPDLGHTFSEDPVPGARNRALIYGDAAPVAAHKPDGGDALRRLVDEKFTSGNVIPVERISITRAEYDAAISAQQDREGK